MTELLDRLNAELSGRYRLTSEAGGGGMATVYRARDLRHAREVAIKVLRHELAAAMGADRFHAEITTTARLQHPNILPLFDSGEAAGRLFYVMPYVDGPTLRARLRRERQLPVSEAVEITCTIAAALQHAHSHGVIHRDIKPDNILLSGGVPVLADFGIAFGVERDATRVTQPGTAIGTVAYMSPEQATGNIDLDPRSDIYSLACVLYEALSGEVPHAGPNVYAIIAKRLTDSPTPIRILRPAVPLHVESALLRALAVAPADRLATAEAFAAALRPPAALTVSPQIVVLRAEPRSYGVLMHEGDDEALRLARERARGLVEAAIESCGGVLHASPGGAVVGCFTDARGCIMSAAAARDAVAQFNASVPAAERISYRFGVAEGGSGGLERASELAWLAPAEGIRVSDPIRAALPAADADTTRAVTVPASPPLPPQLEALDIPPPARPSIAIMPFVFAQGDAESEALAEGLRIDITNAFMKMGRIFLVAPSSMNRFRGAAGTETARRVGTRHVLEGTVRRAGGRVRVAMQLTDTQTGALAWAERYDRVLDDTFVLEDDIAAKVITELDVKLSMGEQARLWRKCLTHPVARQHYYRGLGQFFQSTCDSVAQARAEFERVAHLVPESPVGATWTALSLWIQATNGWEADAPRLAVDWARRAVAMPDNDGQAHAVLGATLLLEQQWDEAIRIARDSVRIRPGCNTANGVLASVLLHSCDYAGAIRHAKRAIRIGPIYPPWFLEILSAAQREAGYLDTAITVAREILRLAPESVSGRLVLAAALLRGGWIDEARHVAREVPRLEPGFAVDSYLANQPFRSSAVKDRLRSNLREAGL